jgi:hypothetical protein
MQPSRRGHLTRVLVGLSLCCAALTAVAWFRVPQLASVDLYRWYPLGLLIEPSVPLLALGAAIGLVLLRRVVLIPFVLLALTTAFASFVCYQRYTAFGVFMFGGDHYWVYRAANSADPPIRRQCLRIAISGVQYTLNTTENEIINHFGDRPQLQRDLFLVLVQLAPNDNWRQIYQRRADDAGARTSHAQEP